MRFTKRKKKKGPPRAPSNLKEVAISSKSTRNNTSLPSFARDNVEAFAKNKARVGINGASLQTERQFKLCGRECYCDELVECSDCSKDFICAEHDGLFCTACDCWFHAKCIGGVISVKDGVKSMKILMCSSESLTIQLDPPSENSKNWYCIRCWENVKDTKRDGGASLAFKDISFTEQALRLGVDPYRNNPNLENRTKLSNAFIKYADELHNSIGDHNYAKSILSNTPRAFPTPKPMDKDSLLQLKFAGRRFEIAQLSLNINSCSCCGCAKPFDDDNWRKNSKITGQTQPGKHLRGQYYKAHKCNCDGVCEGEQFFALNRVKQTDLYKKTHPGDVVHNATLCLKCYKELAEDHRKNEPGIECISRKFSSRNGFGPVSVIPFGVPPGFDLMSPVIKNDTFDREIELRYVLSQLTAAEESAIRMVAPLATIVRLKHGNIGRVGTVACVWQDVKPLLIVLPTLPMECKTLVIRYAKKDGKMSSFRCRRYWIARALRLLKETGAQPWADIVIDESRLKQWPVDGNLMDLVHKVDVEVEDDAALILSKREDDTSLGPAPEQNHEYREEEFIGLVMNNELVDGVGNAEIANKQLSDFACPFDPTIPPGIDAGTVVTSPVSSGRNSSEAVSQSSENTGDVISPLHYSNNENSIILPEVYPLPEVTATKSGKTAFLPAADLLPKGDFVNMKSTPWAWAMSFPTLIFPTLVGGKWVIRGDPTACDIVRDQTPSLIEWGEYMMWRNDGGPARHPTFALILNAEISQTQLRDQGRVFLSRMDISPTMSLVEFQESYKDPAKKRKYHEQLQHSAGNVLGTDQYWKSVRNKFKAAIFYLQYVKKVQMRYFITGSQAEFHDPFLRLVLSKYVTVVENEKAGQLVMTSQDHWFRAVTNYKTVVTHFFAFKNEQWYGHFLKHTLDVHDFQGRYEFTKARGAIHGHGSAASDSRFDKAMDKVLSDLALDLYEKSKEYEEGTVKKTDFDDQCVKLAGLAATRVTNLMERNIGMSASHNGKPPIEWVAPAGRNAGCGHRRETNGMLNKDDVQNTQGLRKFKFNHEHELYRRKIEMTNICFTHTCSSYCWRNRHVRTPYMPSIHDDNLDLVRTLPGKNGKGDIAVMRCSECRMGFGFAKTFATHRCRTGGKDAIRSPKIEFDLNGQPKLSVPRNHPRVLMEPVHVYHWGANADIQRFMNNAITFDEFCERYNEESDTYDDFCKTMDRNGWRGLESASGCNIANDYTCSYQCKGASSTEDWSKCLRVLETNLMDHGGDTPVRSLVGKSMHLIAKSRDCSKDEASFMLSGGRLTFTSNPVKIISMKNIELSDIGDISGDPRKQSFEAMRKRYESRAGLLGINLYKYIALHNQSKEVIPHFIGYKNFPTWPLEEHYAKNVLQLYQPYQDNHNHDGFNSYVEAFTEFLNNDPECPIEIARVVRAKRDRFVYVKDQHEGNEAGTELPSLSDDRNIGVNSVAVEISEAFDVDKEYDETGSMDSHWKNVDFSAFDRGLSHNWSEGYKADGETFLLDISDDFYSKMKSGEQKQSFNKLVTSKPPSPIPENAKGFAQTFLVALTLHALKLNNDSPIFNKDSSSPNYNVFAQGNPGSGKTFIQMTLLNVVRTVCHKMEVAQSIAPTGCAASLLSGTTTNRFCKLPLGRKMYETPSDMKSPLANESVTFQKKMESLLMVLIDETSMIGRSDFAWIGHRFREGRKGLNGCSDRTFGGIPLRMLFQDLMQLPAVAKKSLTDTTPAQLKQRACQIGRNEFSDYIEPKANPADVPVVLVMDAVFRQADGAFKEVLQKMRDGTMDKPAVDYLNKRRWSKLSQEERAIFWRDGIFLMPTWARTIPIVKQYLKDINNPLVVVDADMTNVKYSSHLKDFSWPTKNPLMVGADVQLLHNFFVEAQLFNGKVGKLVGLVYRDGETPNSVPPAMPAYAELQIKGLSFPNGEVWDANRPDVVPIPVTDCRCEGSCCSMTTLPLRVHKATTIHKSQGITVGLGCAHTKVICGFGGRVPGSDLVALSRAQEYLDFAIYDVDPLDNKQLYKIGKGDAADAKRAFCEKLLDLQATSIPPVMASIALHDPSPVKTYAGLSPKPVCHNLLFPGGYKALMEWYNQKITLNGLPTACQSPSSSYITIAKEAEEFSANCANHIIYASKLVTTYTKATKSAKLTQKITRTKPKSTMKKTPTKSSLKSLKNPGPKHSVAATCYNPRTANLNAFNHSLLKSPVPIVTPKRDLISRGEMMPNTLQASVNSTPKPKIASEYNFAAVNNQNTIPSSQKYSAKKNGHHVSSEQIRENDYSSPVVRSKNVFAPSATIKKTLTYKRKLWRSLGESQTNEKRHCSVQNPPLDADWRTYLTTITTHYKEGYSTLPFFGNRTPVELQRGVKQVLQSLKEVRCYVPYDGLCGYHSLAKVLGIDLLAVFELLTTWASSTSAIYLNVTYHHESEINRFEVINERSFKEDVLARVQDCIDHVNTHAPGHSVGLRLYCTLEEVVVVMLITKKRGIILSDVKSRFSACEVARDYLVTMDGIYNVHTADVVGKMVRNVDYEVIIVHEYLHWVYAIAAGEERDPPHTREVSDTHSARIMTEAVISQDRRLRNVQMSMGSNRVCEHSFSIVPQVSVWADLMSSICGRVQKPTSSTGCCGYNGVKQSLYIHDVKLLMRDIKSEVESAIYRHHCDGKEANSEQRDLIRIISALKSVDRYGINEGGWFSDFLAVYVALAYGVTILIIRENGYFTYIQANGICGNITASEVSDNCDLNTFDIVLGSDGDGGHGSDACRGSHWDCWLPVTQELVCTQSRDSTKLGKHLGSSLWKNHLCWASKSLALPISEVDLANAINVE